MVGHADLVGNPPKMSMTSNHVVDEPQRDVEDFRDLTHNRTSLRLEADHPGPQVLGEGHVGICLEGSDEMVVCDTVTAFLSQTSQIGVSNPEKKENK